MQTGFASWSRAAVTGAAIFGLAACGGDDGASPGPTDAGETDARVDGGAPAVDETPPVVTSTRPRNAEEEVPRASELSVRFSEPVLPDSGTIAAAMGAEPIALGELVWEPEGDVVAVRPETGMWPGGARIDVRVEGFVDAAGNAQEGAFELVFHTADDGVPEVASTDPAEGATDVDPALAVIAITFTEPMNAVLGTVALEGGAGALGERAWSSERELRVAVSGLEPGTEYRLSIDGFEDRSGNLLDGTPVLGDGALDFTTASDTTPPTVLSSIPMHEQLDVDVGALREITVTFSEPMDTAERTAVLSDGSSITTLTGNWSADGTTLRFDAVGRVAVDAENRLDLSELRDRSGNALDGTVGLDDGELVFTTSSADESIPFVVFTTPFEGETDASTRLDVLEVVFSEAMDTTLTTADLVSSAETVTLDGAWDPGGTRLRFPLAGLAARTAYTVDLTAFEDVTGNALDATHPYLGDGVLDFTTGAPSGESCGDPLTVADAVVDGGAYEWTLFGSQFTTADGQPSCSPNGSIMDGVLVFEKTTADLAGGGSALRITATSPDAFNGVQLEIFRDVCDPEAVGGGDAAREVCLSARTQWVQYLDVPAGTYYVWVGNEYGLSCSTFGCSGSPFQGATVRIEEVTSIPEGESCVDPFDSTSSVYSSPAADEHVFVVPHGSGSSADYGTSTNGAGAIPCYSRQGPDAVLEVNKARAGSILDVEVDPFPAESFSSSWSLDRAGVVVDVLDACDPSTAGATSFACPGRLNQSTRFQVAGGAGPRWLWLAANNSEVDLLRTTVRVREVDPAPGETCGTAIPLVAGGSNPVVPDVAAAYFPPSCVPTDAGVTWYRFTSTNDLSIVTLTGSAPLALVDASTGTELGCVDDGSVALPYRGASGADICVAVPSDASITGITVRQLDWRGIEGTATDLGISRPLNSSGSEVSITGDSFLAVTPTQLYMAINQNSTTTAGIVTAPRSGGTVADLLSLDRATFGNAGLAHGEALFSVDEQTSPPERLHRLVDSTGSFGPTVWDTGSAYEARPINAMGRIAGTDTVVMANRGTSTVPTTFYTASLAAPGAVTRIGQNSYLRDVVAIEGDGTWLWVIGATAPSGSTIRTVYRLPAADVTAEPEVIVSPDLVGFSSTNGAMEYDAVRDILYFRSTSVPRGVHAVFDAATTEPVYVGAVLVRGGSADHGMALDPTVPALFVFETETVSTGTFIEIR